MENTDIYTPDVYTNEESGVLGSVLGWFQKGGDRSEKRKEETAKTVHDVIQLKSIQEQKKIEIEKQKIKKYYLIGGILVVIIIAVVIIIVVKRKK